MGKKHHARSIPYGIYVFYACLHFLVYPDSTLLNLHTSFIKPDSFGIKTPSYRNKDFFGCKRLPAFKRCLNPSLCNLNTLNRHFRKDCNAVCFKRTKDGPRNRRILGGKYCLKK